MQLRIYFNFMYRCAYCMHFNYIAVVVFLSLHNQLTYTIKYFILIVHYIHTHFVILCMCLIYINILLVFILNTITLFTLLGTSISFMNQFQYKNMHA